jgi:DNA-binding MarR family transcriptional regulator
MVKELGYQELRKRIVVGEIVKLLSTGGKSIAKISEELKIKRSTLNYYLNVMQSEGIIQRKRIEEKVTGRPTIITLTKSTMNKNLEAINNQEEFNQEVLTLINSKKEIDKKELIEKFSNKGMVSRIMGTLIGLENFGYVREVFKLTEEGKKFLKENDKMAKEVKNENE